MIQESFQTFQTATLLGYNKINLSPVNQVFFKPQVQYIIKSVQIQGSLSTFQAQLQYIIKSIPVQ